MRTIPLVLLGAMLGCAAPRARAPSVAVPDASGLESVVLVLDKSGTQRVYITPAKDRTLDLAAIDPAVRTGGARVVRTRVVAKGHVEKDAAGARFVDGAPQLYLLND